MGNAEDFRRGLSTKDISVQGGSNAPKIDIDEILKLDVLIRFEKKYRNYFVNGIKPCITYTGNGFECKVGIPGFQEIKGTFTMDNESYSFEEEMIAGGRNDLGKSTTRCKHVYSHPSNVEMFYEDYHSSGQTEIIHRIERDPSRIELAVHSTKFTNEQEFTSRKVDLTTAEATVDADIAVLDLECTKSCKEYNPDEDQMEHMRRVMGKVACSNNFKGCIQSYSRNISQGIKAAGDPCLSK